jgi:hypothetical protein
MSLNDDIKNFETSADLAFKYTPSKPDTPAEEKNQEEALRAVFGGTTWQHDRQLVSARRIARISFDKLCSLGGDELPPIPLVDSYNQSFRLVPNVGISIKRLEQAAKAMESVEESRLRFGSEVAKANPNASEMVDKIQQYLLYIDTIAL